MDINAAFPSKFLKASDIGEARPIVTIDHVTVEGVGAAKDQRPIVYFTGKSKGMVLNKTNSKAIAQIAASSETDDWAGVAVQLFVAMVEYQGETVEAIRVRAPKTAPPKPAPKPEPVSEDHDDSDIPF